MNILIRIVLMVSLAANVTVAVLLLNRVAKRGTASREKASGSSSIPGNAASEKAGRIAAQPTGNQVINRPVAKTPSLELKEKLRAEGYPESVVRSILVTLLDEKYGPKKTAEQKRQEAEEISILVPDFVRSLDQSRARGDALRYGDLPAQTIEAIKKLEAEHNRDRPRQTPDRKFAEALQAVLTPAQIDEYMRYNSEPAQHVQEILKSIDVDEATYLKLLDAAIAREGSRTPEVKMAELFGRNMTLDSVESYRRILGDEPFLKLAARFDAGVAGADAAYQMAGLSAQQRADFFMEIYALKDRYLGNVMTSGARATGGANREAMAQAARSAYDRIVRQAAFTTEQTAVFDQALGGFLKRDSFTDRQ